MKIVFLCLLLPTLSIAQTVHVKDDKIVYEGKEKLALATQGTITKMQESLSKIIGNYQIEEQSEDSIKARGAFRLKSPHNLIRTVTYSIKLNTTDNGYDYLIDSVSFVEKERGEKAVTKSSKEVVKNMEETGKIVGDTEKILNETDMRFQKLLALLRREIKGKMSLNLNADGSTSE